MYTVTEAGRDPVMCHTLADARQHVEDRAAEVWDRLRDPNDPDAQVYPGVLWLRDSDKLTARMDSERAKNTEWEVTQCQERS